METLSRIHIEQQLLAEVDRAGIPVEQQVDWYKTVSLHLVYRDDISMCSPAEELPR